MKPIYGLKMEKLKYSMDARRKLVESEISLIKNNFLNGEDIKSIAQEFNVHPTTIRRHVDEKYMLKCREYDLEYKKKIGPPENYPEISKRTRTRHKRRISNYNNIVRKVPEVIAKINKTRKENETDRKYRERNREVIQKRDREFYNKNKFKNKNKCLRCGLLILDTSKRCHSCHLKRINSHNSSKEHLKDKQNTKPSPMS